MPLFNQETNLSGRGNFAPGVTYYAGIKAPKAPAVHLPKAQSSFNIDLSRIGDAMIAAKEAETKLGMAAVQMEHDMQQADKDRQLKLELADRERDLRLSLANMEDARARELAANKNALDWQIANLKNDTELQKMAAQKQQSVKDQTKSLANLALSSDRELREGYIDYSNGNKSALEWESMLNEKINGIALQTGANVGDLYTVANAMGYKTGIGSTAQSVIDEQKTLRNQQLTQDIALGGMISPQATESDKAAIGAQFRESTQNVINMNRILSDPESSQMEKDMASRLLINNQDKLIDTVMLRSMTDVNNDMRNTTNPVSFVEASKQLTVDRIAAETGSDRGQLRRRTDAMYKLFNVDKTLNDITAFAENNNKYVKNAYDTYTTQYKMGSIKNSPMLRAATAFGPEFIRGLDDELKEAVYGTMAYSLIGTVVPNYSWTDDKGNQHTGWRWNSVSADPQMFENDYIAQVADELNLTPEGAVYWLSAKALNETPQALSSGRMMPADGVNVTVKALMNTTGNPNEDLSYVGLTPEQITAINKNIVTCVEAGNCTPRQIHAVSESLPEPQKSVIKDYENKISAGAKLGIYLGGGVESARFYEMANYMNPDNINLAVLKGIFNKQINPGDKDRLRLKNTVQYYTIKDGRVYIDYTQQGLLKTGTNELAKAATYVRHTLERAGLTVDEQVAWYKQSYPNMVYVDKVDKSVLTDAFSYLQDATIGIGARVDTQLASWLDKKNKEFLAGTPYVDILEETDKQPSTIWIDTSTGKPGNVVETDISNWIDDEYKGSNYSYSWNGEYLNIQYGDDLLVIKTSATPEQVLDDYMNDPSTLEDYEYAKHYKRKTK